MNTMLLKLTVAAPFMAFGLWTLDTVWTKVEIALNLLKF
jgi:hypothetical protein